MPLQEMRDLLECRKVLNDEVRKHGCATPGPWTRFLQHQGAWPSRVVLPRWKGEWYAALEAGADRPGLPLKPQRVVRDLNVRLAPDALVATDCGHSSSQCATRKTRQSDQLQYAPRLLASTGGSTMARGVDRTA